MPQPEDVPHPRLGPYRGRVGRITDREGASGLVHVDVDVSCTQLGGLLWWRRWSAWRECVVLFVEYPDGELHEVFLEEGELEEEIDRWGRGEFRGHPYRGEEPTRYRLEWLDDETVRVSSDLVGD
jgi:hypothetical protein